MASDRRWLNNGLIVVLQGHDRFLLRLLLNRDDLSFVLRVGGDCRGLRGHWKGRWRRRGSLGLLARLGLGWRMSVMRLMVVVMMVVMAMTVAMSVPVPVVSAVGPVVCQGQGCTQCEGEELKKRNKTVYHRASKICFTCHQSIAEKEPRKRQII